MLMFRHMTIDDLNTVYNDINLRPLLTVPTKGKKFGVVAELDNTIIGGVTGYIDGNNAIIQEVIVENSSNYTIYKDGLIRALIHILELDNLRLLFADPIDDVDIYTNIGFKKYNGCSPNSSSNMLYIDLEDFFSRDSC